MANNSITTGRLFSSGEIKNSVREMHARAAATEPINPAKFNDPMSFQHFFKLVAGCIAHTGRSLESIYPICPKSVHDWFPERVAVKRYVEFLGGEVMEGDISPKVSAPILHILYFGKFDPPVESKSKKEIIILVEPEILPDPIKPHSEKIPLAEFRKEYGLLDQSKGMPFTAVWKLVPEHVKSQYSIRIARSCVFPSDKTGNVPSSLGNAILEAYREFPNLDKDVASDEVLQPFHFEDRVRTMVSVTVAKSQIKKAKKQYQVQGADFISKFSECIGVDPDEGKWLLYRRSTRNNIFPRLRVAIALAIIEGKCVPQETINLHNKYLRDNSAHLDISQMREKLNEIFERANLSPKIIYSAMPEEYQSSVSFNEVAGWFDGQVNKARKNDVHAFLNQSILFLEQECAP